jgi:DNA invertase Pin-like site-specific DNA recombinase
LGQAGRQSSVSKKREKTQEAFDLMLELHQEGCSYQAIADKLNESGHVTSRGGKWDKSIVFRRIKNWQKEQAD